MTDQRTSEPRCLNWSAPPPNAGCTCEVCQRPSNPVSDERRKALDEKVERQLESICAMADLIADGIHPWAARLASIYAITQEQYKGLIGSETALREIERIATPDVATAARPPGAAFEDGSDNL